jgi:hypothetical protein
MGVIDAVCSEGSIVKELGAWWAISYLRSTMQGETNLTVGSSLSEGECHLGS